MNKSFKLYLNQNSNNIGKIKNNIKKLHTIDKDLIPQYLDSLKENLKIKEVSKNNEYLKYM